MNNDQLLVVDTKSKIMNVFDSGKFVRTIEDVWIGKNGCVNKEGKYEGDMKTPLGVFNLGVSFGTNDININYPYIKIDKDSYWVDDVNSDYYNYFVQSSGRKRNVNYPYVVNSLVKNYNSAEHLIDYKKAYKYAVFIEYNCLTINNKPIPGGGSAIFLHCHGNKDYTGGCLAIKEEDMEWVLSFLDYKKDPKIIIK